MPSSDILLVSKEFNRTISRMREGISSVFATICHEPCSILISLVRFVIAYEDEVALVWFGEQMNMSILVGAEQQVSWRV